MIPCPLPSPEGSAPFFVFGRVWSPPLFYPCKHLHRAAQTVPLCPVILASLGRGSPFLFCGCNRMQPGRPGDPRNLLKPGETWENLDPSPTRPPLKQEYYCPPRVRGPHLKNHLKPPLFKIAPLVGLDSVHRKSQLPATVPRPITLAIAGPLTPGDRHLLKTC